MRTNVQCSVDDCKFTAMIRIESRGFCGNHIKVAQELLDQLSFSFDSLLRNRGKCCKDK